MGKTESLKHIQRRPLNRHADLFHDMRIDQRPDAGGPKLVGNAGCLDQPDAGGYCIHVAIFLNISGVIFGNRLDIHGHIIN